MGRFGGRALAALVPALTAWALLLLLHASLTAGEQRGAAKHGIAMHGEPALAEGFAHVPYVNPNAPRGGRLTIGLVGSFDSLNPFIIKGLPLAQMRGYVIESLLARGYDEPFTLYGLLAQSVETDRERTYVTFHLRAEARFADGRPVTAEDVLFSWRLLRDKGRPNHRVYYAKVRRAEALPGGAVRFDLDSSGDRELPLILGLMPIFAQHATDPKTFEQTSFTSLLGSGPYQVALVRPGDSVTLARNPNYWGRDLPINVGSWNFDEVRFDFFRDANVHFEAFKKGLYDVRAENDPSRWETGYDVPAVQDGRIVRETFPSGAPEGMTGLVLNTRRPLFADVRVREAIGLLFDFEWVNRNFFFDLYRRTASYFEGSELSAHGRPADALERAFLARFPGAVRTDILEGRWSPPVSDSSGRDRELLAKALALFAAAGWELRDGALRERRTGQAFSFEILVTTREHERLALAIARDLRRAGIIARPRLVDAVQFDRRRQTFDFDMMPTAWAASLSPGNEQAFYWGSTAADAPGSRNFMGAKSAAIDAAIEALLRAETREEFVSYVRALDRILLSGFYVVPLFHPKGQWVARWTHVAHPDKTPLYGYLPETWWRADLAREPAR